jgi:hypothetical protein
MRNTDNVNKNHTCTYDLFGVKRHLNARFDSSIRNARGGDSVLTAMESSAGKACARERSEEYDRQNNKATKKCRPSNQFGV